MTCAIAYWESGRVEVFGAFPAKPDLKARGKADGVGNLYIEMKRAGELQTFPGYATPVKEFMQFLAEELADEDVQSCISDRNQTSEMKDAVGKTWKLEFSAVGKGFDGTKMIIAFQKMAVSGLLKTNSLMLKSAIAESVVDYDHNGNACWRKADHAGALMPCPPRACAANLPPSNWKNRLAVSGWSNFPDKFGSVANGYKLSRIKNVRLG